MMDNIHKSTSITGVKISYYFICHTKLWLFSHNIQLEKENENVQIGKDLNETSYVRDKKDITIDQTISVDFIEKSKNGEKLILHEIKKSNKMEEAHQWQMMYYLYYFKEKGIEAEGELNYPLINKKEKVILTEKDRNRIQEIINDIFKIIEGKLPSPKKKTICSKCAYFEFCFGDDL
ncbi:MAG: CRISPR-associated protein Cas4 [Methanosarcinales archaeon]|nr:CRISPR-associated protein Cas4 [Methanosarcinales archaeon]